MYKYRVGLVYGPELPISQLLLLFVLSLTHFIRMVFKGEFPKILLYFLVAAVRRHLQHLVVVGLALF